MANFRDLLEEDLKDPEFKALWDESQAARDISGELMAERVKRDITQKELAALTGVPQADISRLESLDANPNLKTLNKLAKGLGKRVRIQFEDIN